MTEEIEIFKVRPETKKKLLDLKTRAEKQTGVGGSMSDFLEGLMIAVTKPKK